MYLFSFIAVPLDGVRLRVKPRWIQLNSSKGAKHGPKNGRIAETVRYAVEGEGVWQYSGHASIKRANWIHSIAVLSRPEPAMPWNKRLPGDVPSTGIARSCP